MLQPAVPRTSHLSRRRVLSLAAGLVSATPLLALHGCGSDASSDVAVTVADPRPLTAEEADHLATVRLRMLRASPVPVRMTWPGQPASVFDAVLDLSRHVGYGTFTIGDPASDGETSASTTVGAVAWDLSSVATAPDDPATSVPPVGAWTLRTLSAELPRDLFLVLALNLGADRPENAQLLRSGSARFLRHDLIGSERVSVLEGPQPAESEPGATPAIGGRTRFWLTDDGDLARFEADLGLGDDALAQVDVLTRLTLPPGLEDAARQALAARG